jgi:hypothetical protein
MTKILLFTFSMFALVMSAQTTPAPAPAAKPADINGGWHFVLDTPGGDRPTDATLQVDADGKVTGKYGKADVAGTYTDGKMELAFPIDTDEAGSGTLKLSGTASGDGLSGDWTFTQYNGTFKATRATADAPAKPAGN